jgi:hypothetical protein
LPFRRLFYKLAILNPLTMKSLSDTWFAEGRIDFELKKYILLAYLQEVNGYFNENKLYPQLSDIIFHYNNLVAFRENKKFLKENFPRRLTGMQMEKLQLLYEQLIYDDELMQELEEIISYSADTMKKTIQNGAAVYEFVEEKIRIIPIGLVPLETNEGYLFLSSGRQTGVYQYRLSIFEKQHEKYRSIKTTFIDSHNNNFSSRYEHIKTELIRQRKDLPNPAVYAIETSLQFPVDETLLPIAKRTLVKYISPAA